MKWKQAKFNIITTDGIKEIEGKITTFDLFDMKLEIGVFCFYQLTNNDFDKRNYSITELTTGRQITTAGSLNAASRLFISG